MPLHHQLAALWRKLPDELTTEVIAATAADDCVTVLVSVTSFDSRRLDAAPREVFHDDRTAIDGRWEASSDGRHRTTDFNVTSRRVAG